MVLFRSSGFDRSGTVLVKERYMFSGSIPALVTPFRDGAFDAPAFARLVDWQIKEGTSALVPCGTTGESPTLGFEEHYPVIDTCIQAAAGRVPVIAGFGRQSAGWGKGGSVRRS